MTIDNVCAALDAFELAHGVPWANEKFKEGDTEPPLIILHAADEEEVFADDLNWPGEMSYTIYLVTEDREYALEKQVKAMLSDLGIAYAFGVESYPDENTIQAYFQFTVED